jgi:hypothetical protein
MTSSSTPTAIATTPFVLGVYVGQPEDTSASNQDEFLSNLAAFETAVGAVPAFFDTYTNVSDPISNWANQNGWQASSWAATPELEKTTPILDLPLTSTQDNADQDYKNFAAGDYDSQIAAIVKAWAQAGDTTQYWRLGWEMNLNGSADYAGDMGSQQQADWIAAFQHVATVVRQDAIADGSTAEIIWNPGVDSYGSAGGAVANLYPGNQYVDIIGADVYSDVYNFSLYDFTTGKTDATFAQWASNPANLMHYYEYPAATQWGDDSSEGHSTTLQSLIDLAKSTGKPLAIAETGAGNSDDSGHDVTDNSAFVEWLYGTLSAAQQEGVTIDFVNIWDSNGGGNYEFSQPGDAKPNEEAAWVQDFGDQSGSTLSVAITGQSLQKDTGVSATDNVTSDGVVELQGSVTGTFGTTVAIKDGGVQLGYALLNGSGGWSFDDTLTAGVHALSAVATDLVGNSVTSAVQATIAVVASPPTLTANVASVTALAGATLSGTVQSAVGVSVAVYNQTTLLGVATMDGKGDWSLSPKLAAGTYSLTVVATDAAGNATSASLPLVVPTGSVSMTQFMADSATSSKFVSVGGGGYRLAVLDTAANIQAGLATFMADAANVSSITATGGLVNVSAASFAANQSVLDTIAGGFEVSDSAANIVANLAALNADTHVDAIVVTGGSAVLTGASGVKAKQLSETGAGASLSVSGNLAYAGLFTEGAGTTLSSPNTVSLTGGSSLGGKTSGAGTLALSGGTNVIASGATVSIAGLSISGLGTSVSLDEGLIYAGKFSEASGDVFTLSGGNLLLDGIDTFVGATVNGSRVLITKGTTSVAGVSIGGSVIWENAGAAVETGAVTLGDSSGGKVVLDNVSTGTFTIANGSGIGVGGPGVSAIINAGLFAKTSNSATSVISASFIDTGVVTVSAGTLALAGPSNLFEGATGQVTGSGTLALIGGTTTFKMGAAMSVGGFTETGSTTLAYFVENLAYAGVFAEGAGARIAIAASNTLTLTGTTTLAGTIGGPGALALAGQATVDAGAILSTAGGLSISGSSTVVTLDEALSLNKAFTETAGATVALTGGRLWLSGVDALAGAAVRGSGVLLTSATTTVSGLAIGGAVTWQNTGVVKQSGAGATIGDANVGDTATLNNMAAGVYDILDNSGIALGASPNSAILNEGQLEKTGGSATSLIGPAITNSGKVSVSSGTLDLRGAVKGGGTDQIIGAANLEFDGSVTNQTVAFSGSGGELILGSAQAFAGTITGFDTMGGNDAIELLGSWNFAGFTENAAHTQGALAFTNGSSHASLTLTGNYLAADFVAHGQSNGGTLLTYV